MQRSKRLSFAGAFCRFLNRLPCLYEQLIQPMVWDPEVLTQHANEAMATTSSRDPQQFMWGVFAWGDAPAACGGGIGAFHWFADLAELQAFLTDLAPAGFMTFDEEAEWLDLRKRLRCIASSLGAKPESAIADLNTELTSLLQIDWVGRLEQLFSGESSYEIKVRARFRNDWEDKPEPVNAIAIPQEEAQGFLGYLREYGH